MLLESIWSNIFADLATLPKRKEIIFSNFEKCIGTIDKLQNYKLGTKRSCIIGKRRIVCNSVTTYIKFFQL